MIGKIIGVSVTGAVGVLLAVFGWLIWKKEKITLLHDYHTDKVAPENRKAFCTLSGIGILVIGLVFMLFVFWQVISKELKPLEQLAHQAEIIASGNFDEPLLTALLLGITESAASFLCFAAAFIAGLALLITAGRKYNN